MAYVCYGSWTWFMLCIINMDSLKMIKISCLADLHGHYPELEGGDLLIVAGDLTARDYSDEYERFFDWLEEQKYKKIIVIAGNHDNYLQSHNLFKGLKPNIQYLCDSGTEFQGLKIWGSPWTKRFEGMNPHCKAFTVDTDEELAKKWALIPDDIDILITHCPPYGILDEVRSDSKWNKGSLFLRSDVMDRIQPKLHVFGHIHECGGKTLETTLTTFVNASHVNEHYEPVNKPIRIEL